MTAFFKIAAAIRAATTAGNAHSPRALAVRAPLACAWRRDAEGRLVRAWAREAADPPQEAGFEHRLAA